jgi:protein gp37
MALLKYENHKLKEQLIFSIPVSMEICGRECKGCYALKPQKRFPAVLKSRNDTYEMTKSGSFPSLMYAELLYFGRKLEKKSVTNRVVRIHEAGEFYSVEYIKKWQQIAKDNSDWTFYSFTKRLKDFPEAFESFRSLPNVFITDSLYDGKQNYGSATEKTPLFVCPATVSDVKCSPEICTWCYENNGASTEGVYFKQH